MLNPSQTCFSGSEGVLLFYKHGTEEVLTRKRLGKASNRLSVDASITEERKEHLIGITWQINEGTTRVG